MRALGFAVIAAALLAACGENAGGASQHTGTLPLTGGVARFVITPPEDGPSWLPELPIALVFEGTDPSFGLVWPEDDTRLRSLGAGDVTAEGVRVFQGVMRDGWYTLMLPPGETPTLSFPRIEVTPRDLDANGIADRLDAVFTVYAEFWGDDFFADGPTFTAHAEAAILPASLGTPRYSPLPFLGDTAVPCDPIRTRFDLPSQIEDARIVTASGEIPVSWSDSPRRLVEFTPAEFLPWAETVRIVGTARVLGAGAAIEPFAVDVPVALSPAAPWTDSFEASNLDGFVVIRGNVELADESDGLPALDGERYLLADAGFGFFFEVDVPDTANPTLQLASRFAFRVDQDSVTPYGELIVSGAAYRYRQGFGGPFDEDRIALEGGAYAAVSPTETIEVPLAALRGSRAVITVRGFPVADRDHPTADGRVQLDGLRLVP